MIIQNMHVIYFLIEKKYTIAGMTIIRAELQTTDFLFLCRSSLLLSEICQNIHIFSFIRSSYFPKFDAQIAANSVSGNLYFKIFKRSSVAMTTRYSYILNFFIFFVQNCKIVERFILLTIQYIL